MRQPLQSVSSSGFHCQNHGADPFVNLPHLREKLIPADKLHSTAHTRGPCGLGSTRTRLRAPRELAPLPDDVREASRNAVLGNRDASEDLWVYAYGSLMWDPGLHFAEVRTAEVEGYQRRFTLKSIGGRGTQDRPCLFLSLEKRPGTCAAGAGLSDIRAGRSL